MPDLLPSTVYAVILRCLDGTEWLDHGSVRATAEASRAAFTEFYTKQGATWRKENVPHRIKRLLLTEPNGEEHA